MPDEPVLTLRGVHKRFGRTEVIRGVDLEVRRGERHALIGPNGAGKSTLFDLVSGRHAPDAGRIALDGRDITGLKPHQVNRRGLSRSFQVTSVFERLSVYENIRCATLYGLGYRHSFWHRLERLPDAAGRTEEVLDRIDLRARRDTPAGLLTYAEQRALEIGIAIAGDAGVILLDEPTAGMSRSESDRAIELIARLAEGRTLVMVEHDMGVVFGLADRISVLVHGTVIATGTPQAIRADRDVQEAYLGVAGAAP